LGTDGSFARVETPESASNQVESVDAMGFIKYIGSSLLECELESIMS